MKRPCAWIAATVLYAHAPLCGAAPELVFADGFETLPYLIPLWLPDACDEPATAISFETAGASSFNTDVDLSCTGGIVPQPGGPGICVVRAKSIRIGGTMSATGSRPLALIADRLLLIDGTLDASANGDQNGAGGGFLDSGGGTTSTSGGGGAGFATNGGAGGGAGGSGSGGAGGSAFSPLDMAVFQGGPNALQASFLDPDGGGGGGGLLLIACRGSVTTTGTINAGGGGGEAAFDTLFGAGVALSKSAGGGGAGGYVVIQGMTLDIGGGLFANGGGGGGGNSVNDSAGTAGSDGNPSTSPASGGPGNGNGGTGGSGGAKNVAPSNGGPGFTAGTGAGGGGSVGVLQLCAPQGVNSVVQPDVVVSPGLSPFIQVPTSDNQDQ